jgi:hypothetical protein
LSSSDIETIEAMRQLGGSFVKALAAAAARADDSNLARLKTAFPEYWSRYEQLAAARRPSAPGRA